MTSPPSGKKATSWTNEMIHFRITMMPSHPFCAVDNFSDAFLTQEIMSKWI